MLGTSKEDPDVGGQVPVHVNYPPGNFLLVIVIPNPFLVFLTLAKALCMRQTDFQNQWSEYSGFLLINKLCPNYWCSSEICLWNKPPFAVHCNNCTCVQWTHFLWQVKDRLQEGTDLSACWNFFSKKKWECYNFLKFRTMSPWIPKGQRFSLWDWESSDTSIMLENQEHGAGRRALGGRPQRLPRPRKPSGYQHTTKRIFPGNLVIMQNPTTKPEAKRRATAEAGGCLRRVNQEDPGRRGAKAWGPPSVSWLWIIMLIPGVF